MFEFEKQFKNYEQAVERVLQTYEYWFNSALSATKEMLKVSKTK